MGLFKILVMGLFAVLTLTQGTNAGVKMGRDEVNERARGQTFVPCNNATAIRCKTHCTGWNYDKCFQNVPGKREHVECTCSTYYWEPWMKVRQSQPEYAETQSLETEEEVKDPKADLSIGLNLRGLPKKCVSGAATDVACSTYCTGETLSEHYCLEKETMNDPNELKYCLCYKLNTN